MEWTVTATQNEDAWFEDYVRDVIAHEPPALPPHDSRIGHVEVHWHQLEPGVAHVVAHGGTLDDQVYAERMLMDQLRPHGYKRATIHYAWPNPEGYQYPTERPYPPGGPNDNNLDQRRYNDLTDKARRIVQSGGVTLLTNGASGTTADVQGDHGKYRVEIKRDDPNSAAHTTSTCTCPWGQFQNLPRTRQWKRFQDRECVHIMATKWQAAATPTDESRAPGNFGDQTGQMSLPGVGGPMSAPSTMPTMQRRNLEQLMAQPSTPWAQLQPAPAGPGAPAPMTTPPASGMPGAPPPTPESALPQFPMDPSLQPQHNPISTPGGKEQTPLNPTQYPQGPGGTFSSWRPASMSHMGAQTYQNGDRVEMLNDDFGTLVGRSEAHGAGQRTSIPKGQIGEVLGTHPSTGMVNVLYMGKPWDLNGEMMPYGATAWHLPSEIRLRNDVPAPGPALRRSR